MDLKLATYFMTFNIETVLRDETTRDKISSLLREMNITKIYLENYRDRHLLSTNEMSKVKDLFEKEFEVAGGVAIGTWDEGWGEKRSLSFNVICILDQKNKELVGKVMSQQAYNI